MKDEERDALKAKIERLRRALLGLLIAAKSPATCDEDWEAEIQAAERELQH